MFGRKKTPADAASNDTAVSLKTFVDITYAKDLRVDTLLR